MLLGVGARLPVTPLYQHTAARPELAGKAVVIAGGMANGIIRAAVFSGHQATCVFLGDVREDEIYRRETPLLFA